MKVHDVCGTHIMDLHQAKAEKDEAKIILAKAEAEKTKAKAEYEQDKSPMNELAYKSAMTCHEEAQRIYAKAQDIYAEAQKRVGIRDDEVLRLEQRGVWSIPRCIPGFFPRIQIYLFSVSLLLSFSLDISLTHTHTHAPHTHFPCLPSASQAPPQLL